MNDTFHALLKEAGFTKEMLGAGASQIRNASYTSKGIYFQSFVSLSTGLERIGKLCLMLDYYIRSDGEFPDFASMKREIGHKLTLLYEKSQKIVADTSIRFRYLGCLSNPIHKSIVSVLHGFAEGDRYANINHLVGSVQTDDPIARWHYEVDTPIFEQCVKGRRKQVIARNAAMLAEAARSWTVVFHTAESGDEVTSLEAASFRTGVYESVSRYRQLYVLQIIRYWVELLAELEGPARAIGKQEIPYFGELFAKFYNDDKFLRSRKTW